MNIKRYNDFEMVNGATVNKIAEELQEALGNIQLSKEELQESISQGVENAFWKMFNDHTPHFSKGVSVIPSTEPPGIKFWDILDQAMKMAFLQVAENESKRR